SFLGALCTFSSGNVQACSCRPLTVKEAYQNAGVVVIGTVVAVKYLTEPGVVLPKPVENMTESERFQHGIVDKMVTVKVKSVVKGKEVAKTIEVITAIDGATCGVYFENGKGYIIYAQTKDLTL